MGYVPTFYLTVLDFSVAYLQRFHSSFGRATCMEYGSFTNCLENPFAPEISNFKTAACLLVLSAANLYHNLPR